jgi:hypothetical protein
MHGKKKGVMVMFKYEKKDEAVTKFSGKPL